MDTGSVGLIPDGSQWPSPSPIADLERKGHYGSQGSQCWLARHKVTGLRDCSLDDILCACARTVIEMNMQHTWRINLTMGHSMGS